MAKATSTTGTMTITLPNGTVIENATLADIQSVTALLATTEVTAPARNSKADHRAVNPNVGESVTRVRDPKTGRYVKAGSKAAVKAGRKVTKAEKAALKARKAERAEASAAYVAARKARQSSNSEMAAWMRENGLQPRGSAWELAKHGERDTNVLASAQRKEAKAAKKAKKA